MSALFWLSFLAALLAVAVTLVAVLSAHGNESAAEQEADGWMS